MTRTLIIISGADRVGKSTLISNTQAHLREQNCAVYHHSAPPSQQANIFDMYREHVEEWLATDKQWCIFDRAYPCSFILEDHRRRNHGHMDDVVDLELEWLADDRFQVVHVSVERPWSWSAKHHLVELKELFPEASPWFIRDEYAARMKEHKHYYERLYEFYDHVTAFPHLIHTPCKDSSYEVSNLVSTIKKVLGGEKLRDRVQDAMLADYVGEVIREGLLKR
jgi:hypothetical protein